MYYIKSIRLNLYSFAKTVISYNVYCCMRPISAYCTRDTFQNDLLVYHVTKLLNEPKEWSRTLMYDNYTSFLFQLNACLETLRDVSVPLNYPVDNI